MIKTVRSLDQFYTRPDVARACVAVLRTHLPDGDWLWIEPSAGAGAFLDAFPDGGVALDLSPRRRDIAQADFLSWSPPATHRRIVVAGNPPFGRNASLARRFFDHAAGFADTIAFILPRTFEKPGFVDRLDRRMHLAAEQILDPGSFELAGVPYAVPTVFQVWEKRANLRPLSVRARFHPDFSFVSRDEGQFAFQRVGARAGLVSVEGLRKSPQSHYFLKTGSCPEALFRRLAAIDWAPIKARTAGNPSIGKAELVEAYRARHG